MYCGVPSITNRLDSDLRFFDGNAPRKSGEKLYCLTGDRKAPADQPPGRFVANSPLEGDGFELSVPRQRISVYRVIRSVACEG